MAPPLTSSTALAPGITVSVSGFGVVAPPVSAAKAGVAMANASAARKAAESNLFMLVSVL
jgi:hypothetical protein